MAEGYEDIERLTTNQNQMLDNALQQQQDITNKQTALNVAELERNKQEIDKDVDKTNKALYAEYRKATNPYGQNAENLASQGLGNSGYAETTQTNLFNTYQRNVTDTLNNARDLKSDFDFQISKARQTGDITLAQNALAIYNQKMQLLTQEYELRNNREQFLYQKDQDRLAQTNWEKEYAMQQNQWQQTFDYQKQRDAVADSQWQQEFDLSKKAAASRSSKKSSGSNNLVVTDNNTNNVSTSQENGTNSETTRDSSFAMIAEKVLNFSQPNSQGRKVMLQGLVKAGTLTQGQADKLLSAT